MLLARAALLPAALLALVASPVNGVAHIVSAPRLSCCLMQLLMPTLMLPFDQLLVGLQRTALVHSSAVIGGERHRASSLCVLRILRVSPRCCAVRLLRAPAPSRARCVCAPTVNVNYFQHCHLLWCRHRSRVRTALRPLRSRPSSTCCRPYLSARFCALHARVPLRYCAIALLRYCAFFASSPVCFVSV